MRLLWLFAFLLLSACTSEKNAIKQGEVLFNKTHIGKNNVIGCIACHSTKQGQVIIGPSLAGLSIRAAHLVAGESAEEYIKNSIINPDAYIVDGYLPAVMFSHYSQELSEDEIDFLVQYLSQLK